MIQRDYAQGRSGPEIERIRDRFLASLHDALVYSRPITLDFIYGEIKKDKDEKGNIVGVMTPLDGQQRLTTLYLLHWYAARKDKVNKNDCSFLSNFSYETRYSARVFCAELTKNYNPSFEGIELSAKIVDQAWFPMSWLNDPTIKSMLVMLDAIHVKFREVDNLWEKLVNDKLIKFYFLPIKDIGQTDDLYIKMNSRGKPLTRFEHVKAELQKCIREAYKEDTTQVDEFMRKIDCDWTDMLWQYRNSGTMTDEDSVIDDEFLRYFYYICDIIGYKNCVNRRENEDEFELLKKFIAVNDTFDTDGVRNNIQIMKSYFDCWYRIYKNDQRNDLIDGFFKSFIDHNSGNGKIVFYSSNDEINIFKDCLRSYTDKNGKFNKARAVLLYAVIEYLLHNDEIDDHLFKQRIRCINNLIQNSSGEFRDNKNPGRMKAILDQTDAIMLYGNIDESTEIGFNRHQIDEEKRKKEFLSKYSDKTEAVLSLEDHERLKGQISIVALKWLSQQDTTPDLDLADYADRFVSLFKCEYDLIDRALMSTGDYKQQDEKSWRYQYGSKSIMSAWDRLFHKSANKGFKDTSEILFKLLSSAKSFKDEHLRNSVDSFISCCKDNATYSWRYYYVNYESFRPGKYGKYHNNNPEKEPYMFSVMLTEERSRTTYMPYLKEADSNHLSDKGDCLIYGHWHIICQNNGYLFRNDESETKKEVCIPVVQKAGIDAEDRIELLKNLIKRLNDWTPEIIYDELLKFKGDQDQKQIEIDPAEKLGEK